MFEQAGAAQFGGGPERLRTGVLRVFAIHNARPLDPKSSKRAAGDLQIPQNRCFELAQIGSGIVTIGHGLELLQTPVQAPRSNLLLELSRSLEVSTGQ